MDEILKPYMHHTSKPQPINKSLYDQFLWYIEMTDAQHPRLLHDAEKIAERMLATGVINPNEYNDLIEQVKAELDIKQNLMGT